MSKIDFAEGGECLPSEMNVPPRNDKTCFHRLIASYTDGIGDGLHAVARPEIRSQENKKTVSKESKSNVARIRLQKLV